MRAYNINVLKRSADRTAPGCHGWVFGLPPGVAAAQWPLDSNTGYPLKHGFTLLLPEDYRVHGPDIVALSFFATAPEQNNGLPKIVPAIRAVMEEASATPPADPDLVPFWRAARDVHPRFHRMRDILDFDYAVILLTREEFDGPLCRPPSLPPNRYLAETKAPEWLSCGSARHFYESCPPVPGGPLDTSAAYQLLGEVPDRDLAFDREIAWVPRTHDPNAGLAPREEWSDGKTGYQPFHYDGDFSPGAFEAYLAAKELGAFHIGGTMLPTQSIPPFSPYYIEFDEAFGCYNFGTGNAQLDFKDMKFDWAC